MATRLSILPLLLTLFILLTSTLVTAYPPRFSRRRGHFPHRTLGGHSCTDGNQHANHFNALPTFHDIGETVMDTVGRLIRGRQVPMMAAPTATAGGFCEMPEIQRAEEEGDRWLVALLE
ncbi:MAG: hypothetical protein MMC33_006694 [Icmadophila ericetorum]|nr:hypothetical protein [Icmadophila ericetorum]